MKKLAVLGDFLEPHHHAQIDSTAARCGFAVDYYPDGHVPAELAGQYEVLYGMPDRAALRTFTGLKWFCGNFAGVDAYLDDALYPSPDVILTNSSGAYGVTIAEHLIMVTLMLLRHASAYVLEAAAHRTMKPADPAFDSVHTHDQLESLLPDTDLLVLALPSTPDTIGFLSRRRIALLPKTAFVINVGRGSAIDQPALVDALNAGQLAGAALDVFVQEPIPDGDPIWDAKNLLLTPHVSGQLSLGYTRDKNVALFCEDLENYAAGRPLARYVDRKIGY